MLICLQTSRPQNLFTDYTSSLAGSTRAVDGDYVKGILEADPHHGPPSNFHVFDVREPYEYNEERIPGAKYTGRGFLEHNIVRQTLSLCKC
ncbi:hypothetical protein HK101_006668 [Irineochytrium annulatum]|nr:hypothetical protein HK101_006668 [Irineochytrium annulatum]